jgi:hypothetical protein
VTISEMCEKFDIYLDELFLDDVEALGKEKVLAAMGRIMTVQGTTADFDLLRPLLDKEWMAKAAEFFPPVSGKYV